jgi:AcrR family transcriptional regulator
MAETLATGVAGGGARDRILNTAYALFSRRGIRAVGVDEIIAHAGVAKATLYKHFPSKNELVLGFLALREERWTRGLVEAGARERAETAELRLLAIFDVFDDWFRSPEFDGCTFINVILELGPDHALGKASIDYLANIRTIVQQFADEAGMRDTANFAWSWHILMKGSIVSASEGDLDAAKRAKAMGARLIAEHMPATA